MLIENGLIRVGLEIEVPYWRDRDLNDVTDMLHEAGYIYGTHNAYEETHQYHCGCSAGCSKVRAGKVMVPPIVAVQYDASLPSSGGEFITSPIIMGQFGINEIRPIWEIITEGAVWDDAIEAINGDYSSPSIHLHISALAAGAANFDDEPIAHSEVMTALEFFTPEIFTLSDLGDYKRGMTYRLPTRRQISHDNTHHGWIQPRAIKYDRNVYLEWRLWEAEYGHWEYVNRAAYLGAALGRVMMSRDRVIDLIAKGAALSPDLSKLDYATQVDHITQLLDADRLETLERIIVENLEDDTMGVQTITNMFEDARMRL